MDDPDERPLAAVADRQVAGGPVDQRVALVGSGGEGQEAGGLVHDQDVAVLVQHAEPAGDRPRLGPAGEVLDRRVGLDLAPGLVAAVARHVDPAVAHRILGGPARQAEPLGHQLVETHRHAKGESDLTSWSVTGVIRADWYRERAALRSVSGRPVPHDPRRPETRQGCGQFPWLDQESRLAGLSPEGARLYTHCSDLPPQARREG